MTHSKYDGIYKKGDEQSEEEISAYLGYRWRCEMIKQGHYDKFDYIAKRNDKISAFVEIRCRSHPYGKFPDFVRTITLQGLTLVRFGGHTAFRVHNELLAERPHLLFSGIAGKQ